MRFASFHAKGKDRIGVAGDGENLIDLSSALIESDSAQRGAGPRTMLELIEAGPDVWERAREIAMRALRNPGEFKRYAAGNVTWHAPIRRPSKICCLALNNSANSERIIQGPKHPAMFFKPASALVGHLGAIECKPEYGRVHPEPELALIIGKTAKNIRAENAYDYVFGYTIHDDITSPTMRGEDTFHYRAIHPMRNDSKEVKYVESWVSYPGRYKGSDTFACMGPWLVTKDEIANPHNLRVSCHHKGELITDDNTENLFYKIPEVLAFLSYYMTLLPGKLRAFGITSPKRSPLLPEIPAINETLPGYEASIFWALFAPANTPRNVIARMHAEVAKFVNNPETKLAFAKQGADLAGSASPEEFGLQVASEHSKWSKIVQEAGIKLE